MENYTTSAYRRVAPRASRKSSLPIAVQIMGHTQYISPEAIIFIQGEGNYSFIYTTGGKRFLVSKTLKALSENLAINFLRVHKSYVVNANFITGRTDDDRILKLVEGKEVIVARRKVKEIASWLDRKVWRISA
ncbi:LytR/AlgR family response regulator transcription factor [Dyadobacter tibetensis]|uniref:LytR/AlgR family response regulator transcription factor n=1 Tax=Dyadobacter tibetensis TaxID=1211851 RepID=UPI00046F1356|nr:LytTR family DNA-binding domain-containing protein [Dyadobacter tibetensis]